jgi:hypothetical protein
MTLPVTLRTQGGFPIQVQPLLQRDVDKAAGDVMSWGNRAQLLFTLAKIGP